MSCYLNVLSHCSVAMKRHHEAILRKHLVGGLLTAVEVACSWVGRSIGSLQAGPGAAAESYALILGQRERASLGPWWTFETSKPTPGDALSTSRPHTS